MRRRLPLWVSSSTPTLTSFPNSQQNTTTTSLGKRSSRGKLCKKVILSDENEYDSGHFHPIHEQDKQQLVEDDDNSKGFKPKPKTKTKRIINNNNHPKPHDLDVEQQQQQYQEEELTVDDLIIIAQEFVNDDDGKDYQQGVTTELESRGSTSRYESSHGIEVLSTHTSAGLLSNSNHHSNNSSNQASKEIIPNYSEAEAGDPAQDMLDLFLGPLLKKPTTTEEKRETYTEEIALDNRFGKACDGEELGKKVPTLMKKKTSLRDKVAMLLD
ncbi:hypothetical protein FRX31_028021 [Thalictrum thalictroides]|uniref:Uncharacterized protein n=1 Tax=Thalictrum thalictroides TaxID=46969 RepID=A0A7J6VBD1_THATH|nr:hypothetical protein FRX31_028021 [Thalictrum thalictroides]